MTRKELKEYNDLVSKYNELYKENQELKKQLTTYQILHRDCKVDNLKNISKIEEIENQQKEFISYLEKEKDRCLTFYSSTPCMYAYDVFKDVLSKYKSIIGGEE